MVTKMIDILVTLVGTTFDLLLLIYFVKGRNIKTGKVLYFTFLLLCVLANVLINMSSMSLPIKMAFIIILLSSWFYNMYEKTHIVETLIIIIVFLLLLGVSEILVIPFVMLKIGIYDVDIFYENTYIWMFSYITSKLLCIMVISAVKKVFKKNTIQMNKREVFIEYAPLLNSFLVFIFFANFLVNVENINYNDIMVAFVMTSVLLLIFAYTHIIVFQHYMEIKIKEHDNKTIIQKAKLEYELYKSKSSKLEELKIIQHDLKNHILMAKDESSNNYFNKLLERIDDNFSLIDTGNRIIDVLFEDKYKFALSKNIAMNFQIEKGVINCLNEIDACSLLGNLIDNSIEACENISDRKTSILVKMQKINSFMLILVENDMNSKNIKKKGEKLLTTKLSTYEHGIGLKGVRMVVEKYDGQYKYKLKDTKFVTRILIPINQENN